MTAPGAVARRGQLEHGAAAVSAESRAGARAGYLLVSRALSTLAGGDAAGWTLMGYRGGVRCWSMDLAARGAPATASAQLAQAVAERVLAGHGITTEGWQSIDARDDPDTFWAAADPRGSRGHVLRASYGH